MTGTAGCWTSRAAETAERVWAIEDCRNVSGALERFLLRAGERVIRVHPKLMATERKVARRPGKSDVIDATAVARAAIREDDLPVAYLAGPEREIAWLVDHRAQLVAERTRVCCRLRWLLHDLDPGLQPPARGLGNAHALARLDRRWRRWSRSRRSGSAGAWSSASASSTRRSPGSRASSRRWSSAATRCCSPSPAAA